MHKRNNVHSLLIPCSSDYISSVWPPISPQSPPFKQSSGSRQQREGKEHIFSRVLQILLCQGGPPSSVPSALLLHWLLSLHPPICRGLFHLSNKKQNYFPLKLVAPLKYYFIFPFSLTVELQLKVGFTSLTSPTLHSFLSLSFTLRTFQKFLS